MVELKGKEDFVGLKRDGWGIPTVGEDLRGRREGFEEVKAGEGGVEVVVMPGVAFDRKGGRCGHGRGFYDLWLNRYCGVLEGRGAGRPVLVGLALEEQVLGVGEVPVGEGDWRVDVIVTGGGECLRRGGE